MVLAVKPFVSAGTAGCCTVLSVFGVVILCVFGYFFQHRAHALTGSTHDPADPDYVAKLCYTAAIVYAVFVGVCGIQTLGFTPFSYPLCPAKPSSACMCAIPEVCSCRS